MAAHDHAVIAGIDGQLVSHAYLEQQVLTHLDYAATAAFERHVLQWWRAVSQRIGPTAGARQVFDVAAAPLLDSLGYTVSMVRPVGGMLVGVAAAERSTAALVAVLPWSMRVDQAWREAVRGGAGVEAPWALVTNGRSLQIVDCARPWARQVLQFDFASLLMQPSGARLLWTLAGAHATGGAGPQALRGRVDASASHAARVCHALGDGVLTALPALASSLAAGTARGPAPPYDQALTVVYRVLFLLFAEARGLVPLWHPVYREAYTIDALCQRAAGAGAPRGLWAALQATARIAHAGCRAGDLDVTAFNGRLFSPRHAPLVEQRRVPDEVVRALILALATVETPAGRHRIAYHDLGVEQLGAVYERVLEHEPVATRAGLVLRRTSTERKATGSFYTPRSITEFLVRRTLHPLVADRPARDILALRVIDPAMGSGAFLVAACHYLADQCEHAMVRDGEWVARSVSPADRAGLRRQVAEQCLYGVDLNATAVQLARLSLWLTTLAAGKPLTFLDHHLAVGNSLIGGRLADLARPLRPGVRHSRAPLPLFDDEAIEAAAEQVLPARLRLGMEASDSLQAVRVKEQLLERLSAADGPFATWTRALDAWCAAALWPGAMPAPATVREWITALLGGATTLPAAPLSQCLAEAAAVAASHAVFHWELAFPEVFFDPAGRPRAGGGFDAVLGNPPWDMVRADSGSAASRGADRARTAPVRRFLQSSGHFTAQGPGHGNRYQLFAERTLQLTRPGGRFGLILPSGIATDHGSAPLRRRLLDRTTIDTWISLDNTAGIFPIHRSVRFVVIAATNAGGTEVLRFRSGLRDPAVLDGLASDARHDAGAEFLGVTRSRLAAWDPEHLTVPALASRFDLAILTSATSNAPPLGDAQGWHVRFGRELNATEDRVHFVAPPRRGRQSVLPVVAGKQLAPFQVRVGEATAAIRRGTAGRLIDPAISFARERIGYRDVASATNRLTLIAGLLPRDVLSTHTVYVLKTPLDTSSQWCLLGLLNSLVANFLVRLNVTTHVTTALMARLPVPRPAAGSPAFAQIASLARRLASAGIETAPDAYAKLNAMVARLYGIGGDDYVHVVASFPLLPRALRDRCLEAERAARH